MKFDSGTVGARPITSPLLSRSRTRRNESLPASGPGGPRNFGPLWLLLAAVALTGCKSVLVSSYISPRVTGRVLAADTRQALADVQVRRLNPTAQASYDDSTKGGQRLAPAAGVRTDQAGRFVLSAERDLTLVQQQIWFAVAVSFQHDGYRTLRTNFTLANLATNTPDAVPVVNAGDILLQPTSP